ncbi:MAG TPA: MFS transporter [Caulobacteraceae bacterium]|nr:MFS transporter [Caulobacteraceae bacterium]
MASPVPAPRRSQVRWLILALLTGFSVVSYIERINLTVSARFIRDEFRLSDTQIGWSFSIFLFSYTMAQLPAGMLVDRFGARRVLSVAAVFWFLITLLLGILVGRLAVDAAQVVAALIAMRLLLGLAESPTFPGAASTVARWFPPSARGMPNAIIQSASYAGEALTLILMATITAWLGWRNALYASALPALLLALLWWRFGASRPRDDPRVSPAELAYIERREWAPVVTPSQQSLRLLLNPKLLFLSLGYFCQGYVTYLFFFWFYIYLVDERHFSIAAGGWVGALPTIAAAVCAFGGGHLSDSLARRFGPIPGRRGLIVAAGLGGGACLLVGAFARQPWLAVAGFATAIGTRGLVESAFWSTINDIGGDSSGMAGGAMNCMGNFGGVVSTAIAPFLVAALGWNTAMGIAAGATALSGLLMFGLVDAKVRPDTSAEGMAVQRHDHQPT